MFVDDILNGNLKSIYENFLKLIREFVISNEVYDYYTLCRSQDEKLKRIQNDVVSMLKQFLQYSIVPASSFTACINLIDDSDLDIVVLVNSMEEIQDVSKLLIGNNFTFDSIGSEGKPEEYWIHSKVIENTTIEVKVRVDSLCKEIMARHVYLDNMSINDKKVITYIKKTLYNTDDYKKFKRLIYEHASYPTNATRPMYS